MLTSGAAEPVALSTLARTAQQSAARLGFSFAFVDGEGYLFRIGYGERQALLGTGNCSPYAQNPACGYTLARDKHYTFQVLRQLDVPTIDSRLYFLNSRQAAFRLPGRELRDLAEFAGSAAFPLFCKPNLGSRGEYAQAVESREALFAWVKQVAPYYDSIVVQPVISGREFRVFVLQGEILYAYRKRRAQVVGDGVSSLGELLQGHARRTGRTLSLEGLKRRDGSLAASQDVLIAGEALDLPGPANRAAGGGQEDFTLTPPPALAQAALRATEALGLAVAGVDLFDRSLAEDFSDLLVIEVNANPNIETLEDLGQWDLIDTLWRSTFEAALARG